MNITEAQLLGEYHKAHQLWGSHIDDAEHHFQLPRFLLYAVGSRETHLENIVGDGGHGHGIWQLDNRSHHIPRPFPVARQVQIAGSMLQGLLHMYRQEIKQAAAAYNAGIAKANAGIREGNVDKYTTGGDYGSDVRERRWFLFAHFEGK